MYFYKKEKKISDLFLKNGYFIGQTETLIQNQITRLIKRKLHKIIKKMFPLIVYTQKLIKII